MFRSRLPGRLIFVFVFLLACPLIINWSNRDIVMIITLGHSDSEGLSVFVYAIKKCFSSAIIWRTESDLCSNLAAVNKM